MLRYRSMVRPKHVLGKAYSRHEREPVLLHLTHLFSKPKHLALPSNLQK